MSEFALTPPRAVDRLTQLQHEMDRIAVLHFNSIGLLQRDAPSADDAAATAAFHENTRALARQLVQTHALVDELLASLPPAALAAPDAQRQRIAALDAAAAAASTDLQAAVADADAWLARLRDTLTAVGEHRFQLGDDQ